jgi:hypothetical protein
LPQMKVKPRKLKVSGLPTPLAALRRKASELDEPALLRRAHRGQDIYVTTSGGFSSQSLTRAGGVRRRVLLRSGQRYRRISLFAPLPLNLDR